MGAGVRDSFSDSFLPERKDKCLSFNTLVSEPARSIPSRVLAFVLQPTDFGLHPPTKCTYLLAG